MILLTLDFRNHLGYLRIGRKSNQGFPLLVPLKELTSFEPSELGSSVLEALAQARDEESRTWPTEELRAQGDSLYAMSGTKGWADYVRGTAQVTITQEEQSVTVAPSQNQGSRRGFITLPKTDWIELVEPNATELGDAVRAALERSGASFP